jgi:hypothetical protein
MISLSEMPMGPSPPFLVVSLSRLLVLLLFCLLLTSSSRLGCVLLSPVRRLFVFTADRLPLAAAAAFLVWEPFNFTASHSRWHFPSSLHINRTGTESAADHSGGFPCFPLDWIQNI